MTMSNVDQLTRHVNVMLMLLSVPSSFMWSMSSPLQSTTPVYLMLKVKVIYTTLTKREILCLIDENELVLTVTL